MTQPDPPAYDQGIVLDVLLFFFFSERLRPSFNSRFCGGLSSLFILSFFLLVFTFTLLEYISLYRTCVSGVSVPIDANLYWLNNYNKENETTHTHKKKMKRDEIREAS